MAWRIDEQVIRGEIDNRTRDRVTGRLWLVGREEPVELDLAGNAWRDLAGRRLEFVNPAPLPGDLTGFATQQSGAIGDCTASRKVKVPDVSREEFAELYRQRKPFPWHWANSLYLEWFSRRNGRVVIETASFQLTILPETAWEMTPAEEEQQLRANAAAMENAMNLLAEAAAAAADAAEDANDDDKPMTEEETEKMQAESDRLTDRLQARLEREGPDADFRKILEEERERRARERGTPPPTPEDEAKRAAWVEEMNRAAEEALANPDPAHEAELELEHPLAERAFALIRGPMSEPEARGWVPAGAIPEHPVIDLVESVSVAAVKLAGALNGCAWPPKLDFCAHTIVRLKRARESLVDALHAADACAEQSLTEPGWLAGVQDELREIAEACDALIAELRAKLERGAS